MPTTVADGPLTGAPSWVVAWFIFVGVVAVLTVGFRVVRAARRFDVYRRAGLDPMTHDAQVEAKIARARFMTESKSVEQRLADLDDLLQRGIITESERAEARARILAEG